MQNPGKITGQYQMLFAVPKRAIVDYLTDGRVDRSKVSQAYQRVTGLSADMTDQLLSGLSVSDLVLVFAHCVSEDEARKLHEEYRYRGMKSFYLYRCNQLKDPISIDTAALNHTIRGIQSGLERNPAYYTRDLDVRTIEKVGTNGGLYELSYRYKARIYYTEDYSELPAHVDDLRSGFVWMHPSAGWVAVCARDERIESVLAQSIQDYLHCTLRRVRIPKDALHVLQSESDLRRASFRDPQTKVVRRYGGEGLASNPVAMSEVRQRNEHDQRPASGYTEHLGNTIEFALGYTAERGRIFLSRDLTVTQMRQWGPEKITEIINVTNDMLDTQPAQILQLSTDELRGVGVAVKQAVIELTSAIYDCKKRSVSEVALQSDALSLGQTLGRFADVVPLVDCSACDEETAILCPKCGGTNLSIHKQKVQCERCHSCVDLARVECAEGHMASVRSVSDMAQLIPRQQLLRFVTTLFHTFPDFAFNDTEEFFVVRSNRLTYMAPTGQVLYSMDEIPELSALLFAPVPSGDDAAIRTALAKFKEKCKMHGKHTCPTCVQNNSGRKCYLRLFALFDPDFTPHAHEGHEFGDYGRDITIGGKSGQHLAVAIKPSGQIGGSELHTGDNAGKELLAQTTKYRHDIRMDVIGVCVPRGLDAGLRTYLSCDAQKSSKKLLVIDDTDLVRMVYAVMQRQNMALDDI